MQVRLHGIGGGVFVGQRPPPSPLAPCRNLSKTESGKQKVAVCFLLSGHRSLKVKTKSNHPVPRCFHTHISASRNLKIQALFLYGPDMSSFESGPRRFRVEGSVFFGQDFIVEISRESHQLNTEQSLQISCKSSFLAPEDRASDTSGQTTAGVSERMAIAFKELQPGTCSCHEGRNSS